MNRQMSVFLGSVVLVMSTGLGLAQQPGDWGTQADSLRGQNGKQVAFVCPAGGTVSDRLWGTDLYTDDSSVCTAAVHAGVITAAQGGTVTVEIRPGAASYKGTVRHGVTSNDYGEWTGSFAVVPGMAWTTGEGPTTIDWTAQADRYRGRNGEELSFRCPAGGKLSDRVWGGDIYTDDSSICTAAVHAGLITAAQGGTVTVEIRAGAASYRGSARHGVVSKDYGQWSGSFVFVQLP